MTKTFKRAFQINITIDMNDVKNNGMDLSYMAEHLGLFETYYYFSKIGFRWIIDNHIFI